MSLPFFRFGCPQPTKRRKYARGFAVKGHSALAETPAYFHEGHIHHLQPDREDKSWAMMNVIDGPRPTRRCVFSRRTAGHHNHLLSRFGDGHMNTKGINVTFGIEKKRGRYDRAVPPPAGMSSATGPAPSASSIRRYLCDGGSRPNPGATQPIVHDGTGFLKVPSGQGGNHTAIYEAIGFALTDATSNGFTDIEIWMFSRHVWGQLTDNEGVDQLSHHLACTKRQARTFGSVEWVLVMPPVTVASSIVHSRRALRSLARRQLAQITSKPSAPPKTPTPPQLQAVAPPPQHQGP